MSLRELKELSFGAPAEVLAKWRVDPDMVTALSAVCALLAEAMTVEQRASLANLKELELSEEKTLGPWIVTILRALSIALDGLDGSVARARKKQNPDYVNKNGQIKDGITDRALATIRLLMESLHQGKERLNFAALLTALLSVLANVPSFLRAKVEAKGGVVPSDQALNPIEFAGTQFGRMVILNATSLELSQVNQLIALTSSEKELTESQWEKIKLILLGYLGLSTGVVIVKRLAAYQEAAFESRLLDETGSFVDRKPAAVGTRDSSGFEGKTKEDHEERATAYLIALLVSAVAATVTIGKISKRKKRSS